MILLTTAVSRWPFTSSKMLAVANGVDWAAPPSLPTFVMQVSHKSFISATNWSRIQQQNSRILQNPDQFSPHVQPMISISWLGILEYNIRNNTLLKTLVLRFPFKWITLDTYPCLLNYCERQFRASKTCLLRQWGKPKTRYEERPHL